MHSEFKILEKTVDHLKDYAGTKIDELKLGTAEKVSDVASVFIAKFLVGLVFLFALIFGSTSAAYGLGDYFNKTWLGFLIIAGLYFVVGLITWGARQKLFRIPIMNEIISRLFSNQNRTNEKN